MTYENDQKKKKKPHYYVYTVDSNDVDGSLVFLWYEFRRMAVAIQIWQEILLKSPRSWPRKKPMDGKRIKNLYI